MDLGRAAESLHDSIDLPGEPSIPVGDPTNIVADQADGHAIPRVRPIGVVIKVLGHLGHRGHEGERGREVPEQELPPEPSDRLLPM